MKHSETYENLTLAIDTSSKASSVALAANQTLIASVNIAASAQTSRILFKEIESLLSLTGVKPDQIERFGAITGPGSFTGLRVGLAVIESMSRTLERPGIGITAFDAVAASIGVTGTVAVLSEAGKGEVFCGIRRVTDNGEIVTDGDDSVIQVGVVIESLFQRFSNQKLVVTGSGFNLHRALFQTEMALALGSSASNWLFLSSTPFLAGAAARLSALESRSIVSNNLRAYYIKPPDAMVKAATKSSDTSWNFEVTGVEPEEIPAVVRLEMSGGLTSRGVESYKNFLKEGGAMLLVARSSAGGNVSDEIVGSASGHVVVDELQIDNLIVDTRYRRRGVGRQLMKKALEAAFAQGATSAVLEVRVSAEAARALYLALGFREADRRKDYYVNPREDALTLVLQLGDRPSGPA